MVLEEGFLLLVVHPTRILEVGALDLLEVVALFEDRGDEVLVDEGRVEGEKEHEDRA